MRVFRERVFWFDHPDGGRFAIWPATGDERKIMDELMTTEYVTYNGQLVYNRDTGVPVSRSRQNLEVVIQKAISKVKTFEDIVNGDTGEKLEPSPETIAWLVRNYIGTTEIEVDVPVEDPKEGEPKKRKEKRLVPHPLYTWVMERYREATDMLREEQRKNS